MSLPKFDETFYPILSVLKNGATVKSSDLPDMLIEHKFFNPTQEELLLKTASGGNVFRDRVSWGKTYLKQGKFVAQPGRGLVQLTQKGKDFLVTGSKKFLLSDLKHDSDYIAYEPIVNPSKRGGESLLENNSPQDLVDLGFKNLSNNLKKELLDQLFQTNPYYFQNVILILFQKMGYGDFESTPKSGDGGIDGIINQDQLGVERIYIQAKRYKEGNKVREPDIRNFIGAMSGDVSKGIFVTTSTFDELAEKKARGDRNHTIILIDGIKLVDLMIKFDVGVQTKTKYEIKEIDEDFFEQN